MHFQTIEAIVDAYTEKYPELSPFQILTLAHQAQLIQVTAHGLGVNYSDRPHLSFVYEKLEHIEKALKGNE